MAQNSETGLGDRTGGPHTARDLAVLVAMVALVGAPSLFTRDLWNPDEPRYTEVAREMVALGDYVLPHLNGEPYPDKAPVFFWLTAALWKAGAGFNSGRIVTLCAVLATLVLVYLAVRGTVGGKGALLAAAAALSTGLLFKFARRGVLDPLLMFTVTAALICGYYALRREARHPRLLWLACYAATALGVLNKGPVALAWTALPLLVYGILARKELKAGGWVHLAGVAVLAAIALAWVIPACKAGGEEYTGDLLGGPFARVRESESHGAPFHFYLLQAPLFLLPWMLVLPLAVIAAVRRWRTEREHLPLLATAWLIVPVLFFSLISGKRIVYILPIVPAVGILLGWYFTADGVRQGGLLAAEKWLMGIAFCLLIALAVALVLAPGFAAVLSGAKGLRDMFKIDSEALELVRDVFTPWRVAALALLPMLLVSLCVWGLTTSVATGARRAALLAGAVLAFSLPVDLVLTPMANGFKSGRDFGLLARGHAREDEPIYVFGDNFSNLYNLYTSRVHMPLLERDEGERLRGLLSRPGTLVISRRKRINRVLTPDEQQRYIVHEKRVGHRIMVLLRGRASAPEKAGKRDGA
ncbi:MAG: glycosyltransferase family 39 protein [Candidatus Brocadiia bacterium]|jgi:4-amino-4-deoxy-L-arabinose transferase-like glycosyltransferase|nr:glycosyltransferase family 39 protein [Candidatus Brocadiia bacterium]